ncbi:MAG: hypothetical protein CBB97_14770 [Candidatus Endolissoclinum sp. TMED37]|nr:MAG: hypothetical protein CBB97_14770 [Candidatus Endolissoclinum sp. TMED37]|tara:strand:- start:3654 stop:4088 length:435 start_codon:yes stop_codon:yes gene_type:complete
MPSTKKLTTFNKEFGDFEFGEGFHYYWYIHTRNVHLNYGLLFIWSDESKKNKSKKMGKLMLFNSNQERDIAINTVDDLPVHLELYKFIIKTPLLWNGKKLYRLNNFSNDGISESLTKNLLRKANAHPGEFVTSLTKNDLDKYAI